MRCNNTYLLITRFSIFFHNEYSRTERCVRLYNGNGIAIVVPISYDSEHGGGLLFVMGRLGYLPIVSVKTVPVKTCNFWSGVGAPFLGGKYHYHGKY